MDYLNQSKLPHPNTWEDVLAHSETWPTDQQKIFLNALHECIEYVAMTMRDPDFVDINKTKALLALMEAFACWKRNFGETDSINLWELFVSHVGIRITLQPVKELYEITRGPDVHPDVEELPDHPAKEILILMMDKDGGLSRTPIGPTYKDIRNRLRKLGVTFLIDKLP